MENNTISINARTGEATRIYVEPIVINEELVIDYDTEVDNLIRQRYSQSQEFSILRQKEEKPDEYQEYYNYCESCKAQVKAMIG